MARPIHDLIAAEVCAASLARYSTDLVADIAIQRGHGGPCETYMKCALSSLSDLEGATARLRAMLESEVAKFGLDLGEAA